MEKNLHNDLNTLIKNIKTREDQHLAILQYNKNLIAKQKELDSIAFLNEELIAHREFFKETVILHDSIKNEEQEMLEKY